MARPTKQGLEYFALDVKMDDETELIEAQHGHAGFVVLIKMFQKIYSNGYYLRWDNKQQILFSKKVSVDKNEVISIINDCLEWGLFNKELYEKHSILTSKRIQEHYSRSVYKRVGIKMYLEYLLIDVSDINYIETIRVSDNGNSDTTKVSDSKSTQSKEKESIEKENTEKENTVSIPYADIVDYLNDKTGKSFKPSTNKTKESIKARWNEGFVVEDFKHVIDTKVSEWKGDNNMEKFLRPDTLFGTKFEGYLNQVPKKTPKDNLIKFEDKRKNRIEELKGYISLGRDYWKMDGNEEVYYRLQEELKEIEQQL